MRRSYMSECQSCMNPFPMPMEIEDFSESELLVVDKSGKYCPKCQLSRIVTRAHQMGFDEGVKAEIQTVNSGSQDAWFMARQNMGG